LPAEKAKRRYNPESINYKKGFPWVSVNAELYPYVNSIETLVSCRHAETDLQSEHFLDL